MTRTIPLTVLVWEGPQARAYLVSLRRAGLRPQRIIVMLGNKIASTPLGANPLLQKVAEQRQDKSNNFHAYAIRKQHPQVVAAIGEAMNAVVPNANAFIDEMFNDFRYETYADDVIRIVAAKYGDDAVREALTSTPAKTVLFTGGGLVPKSVFAIPGIRLIHVHTGFLPHVRGADVLLWSMLVRDRPGVAAFFMTPGLDDGDVLATKELEPLNIELPTHIRPDDDTLYRALFCFIDPLIRADLLVNDVLATASDDLNLTATPQDLNVGVTFHFMNSTVRERALRKLFPAARHEAANQADAVVRDPGPNYDKYYTKTSVIAPLRFFADSLRAKTPLRAKGLRNRQADYAAVLNNPSLRNTHSAINQLLARQATEWDTYDYGEGYHYQSSNELAITGLRDTAGRVEAFKLNERLRNKTVLEIGCNTGFIALAVASSVQRIVGFEVNPLLIEIANVGAKHLGTTTTEFLTSSFEDFNSDERFDVVLSFANHHTYDGNTHQSLDEYFARCHHYSKPDGVLLFESHPPALEGIDFAKTVAIIERYYTITESEIHQYGTFLDRDRRFIVATRRDEIAPVG